MTEKSKQKTKTWNTCSKYVRLRDADDKGFCTCVTCGVVRRWNDDIQAGHCIQGRHNSVIYDERAIHAQCKSCNWGLGGNYVKYTLWMIKRYGKKVMDDLLRLDKINKSFTILELKEIERSFKEKVKQFEYKI